MPTVEERIKELESVAKARRTQRERDGAAGKSLYGDPGVRSDAGLASVRAKAETTTATPSAPHPDRGEGIGGSIKRFSDYTGDVQRTFADRLTRGGANYITSMMSGKSVEEEAKETGEAAERAGGVGKVMGFVGDVAPAALVPGAAVAGPVRAALTGAALGGGDTTLNSLLREQQAPTMGEVGMSAVFGAGGGVLGTYMGRFMADRYAKMVGADKPLHKQTQASLKRVIDEQNKAASLMRDADVKLNRFSVRGLARRIEKHILNNREFSVPFRLKDGAPATRQALTRIKELTDIEAKPSFDDVNELRKFIRESARNNSGEIVINKRDSDMITYIDKTMKEYLETIGSSPKGHVVSGNVRQAVQGFHTMNKLTQDKHKQNVISAVLERAHWSETAGTSYDKAVQQQFKSLVQPSIRGKRNPALSQFDADEIKLLEEAAEGGLATKVLNRMDQSFGHGLLSDLHRTYAIATRKAVKPGAIREAGKVFEGIGGQLPAGPAIPQALGARTGIAGGMMADDEITGAPVPLPPQ